MIPKGTRVCVDTDQLLATQGESLGLRLKVPDVRVDDVVQA